MVALPHKTINSFWSGRKLLIAFHLLHKKTKQSIPLSDLVYPFHYPRSLVTDTWEAYRIFRCLINLEDIGITVKKIAIDPLFYSHGEMDAYWNLNNIPTEFTAQDVNTIINGPFADDINQEGQGAFILTRDPIPVSVQNALRAPGFFHCMLEINGRKLKKALTTYLKEYKTGQLRGRQSVFGYSFTNRLWEKFFKTLTFRQGTHLSYRLGSRSTVSDELQDQFTDSFHRSFAYEYDLWRKGEYQLPFLEHLISLTLNEELTLDSFEVASPDFDPEHPEPNLLHRWSLHRLKLSVNLSFTQIVPKPQSSLKFWSKKISVIEIEPSNTKQFFVYLNQVYKEPLILTKATKSGKLWYTLVTDGFVEFAPFRRIYEYINTDPRFKFFAKTKYSPHHLLERDGDGYIIPATGVSIRFRR